MIDLLFSIESDYFAISLFVVGVITGLVGAMGGPSGLVILPFMIIGGMTPVMALATARLASLFPWFITVAKFKQAGQLRMPELIYMTIIGLVAGVIGTFLILDLDEKHVYPFVGVVLMLVALLSFVKKDFGDVSKQHGLIRKSSGYVLYFIIMLYGGFFGAGASTLAIFTLVGFMGFKMFEAHATHLAAWVPMIVASCTIFIINDQINYYYALITFVSMTIGSIIGSKIIIAKGNRWVKIIVCSFAFVIGVKLLIDHL